MQRLYCRNCGYDLSPMFANGEESGTCPECVAVSLMERLAHRRWRSRLWIISLGTGAAISFFGTVSLLSFSYAFKAAERLGPLVLSVVPVATLVAVVVAVVGFRRRVRIHAAEGEFWGLVISIGLVSLIINAALHAAVFATMVFGWILWTR